MAAIRRVVDDNGEPAQRTVERRSLLLASGLWAPTRQFHDVFELRPRGRGASSATRAWRNGLAPLLYAAFLTALQSVHRAGRDGAKCRQKYGSDFKRYMKLVPHRTLPGVI